MAREFKFQDPGEGLHEGEIADILVSVGDEVEEGDDVLVVETDKATTELPSPFSGKISEIHISEGDVVEVGDVMITFSSEGDESGEEEKEDQDQGEKESKAEKKQKKQKKEEQEDEESAKKDKEAEADSNDEKEEEKSKKSGGKAAAVGELPEFQEAEKKDKEPEKKGKRKEKASGKESKKGADDKKQQSERPVPASPATRRLARELDVDLSDVEPSGPHGRVVDEDVRAAAGEAAEGKGGGKKGEKEKEKGKSEAKERGKPAREAKGIERPPLPDFERWGEVERQPIRSIRRQTARRMSLSWQEIPHVTHHDLVDVTDLERWRRENASKIEETGGKLSLMVLVMKAASGVLARHPRFNASFDVEAQELILKRYYHFGVAVDTENGLVVGVVRDVDRKPLGQLASDVNEMVERVRSRDVKSDELRGGTFTVTNVGPLGGTAFEPLVNYPEVAILGMARARLEQVVTGDLDDPEVTVRYMLPLSLSYDHRVNDGADAARFVSDLAKALHDPDTLLLNV